MNKFTQQKYFISKQQIPFQDLKQDQKDLSPNDILQINRKQSYIKIDKDQKVEITKKLTLNNNILSSLKQKVQEQTNKTDLSQISQLSKNSKLSQKSQQCQIKKNFNSNSKFSQNSTKSKPTQMSKPSQLKKDSESSKKLNSQIIQLLLSKKTPTNIQQRADNKLNSDPQKKTITPIMQKNEINNQKSENLKPILPITNKSNKDSLQNLLKFQNQLQQKLKIQSIEDQSAIQCDDEEIQNFDISSESESQKSQVCPILMKMEEREKQYQISQKYVNNFCKDQKFITIQMRSILLDWMQQVCMEYMWKRETFHLAQYYLDKFLELNNNIQKHNLQLLGVTTLQIATKIEEITPPSIQILKQATANIYNTNEINEMEIRILKTLKYKLNPQTKNTWAIYYILQWDTFVDENNQFYQKAAIYFKKPNQSSYLLFRELFQILEMSILDIKSLLYQTKQLISSIIYLTIGRNSQFFNQNQILNQNINFEVSPFGFNQFFQSFLLQTFNFTLKDIISCIQYCSFFYRFEFNFEFPRGAKVNKDNVIQSHFEDFLAFQTYNPYNQNFISQV